MRWPRWLRWRRRQGPQPSEPMSTADALRRLHSNYQKQKRMWLYSVLSSLVLVSLFVVLSLFSSASWWVLALPAAGSIISLTQIHRCNDIVRILRHALVVQHQVDRAQAEAEQQQKEEEARAVEAQAGGPDTGEPEEEAGKSQMEVEGPDPSNGREDLSPEAPDVPD